MLGLLVADLVDHLGLGAPDVVAERGARLTGPKYRGPLTPEQRDRKNASERARRARARAEKEATR